MKIKSGFEIVEVGDEHMLIPVGDEASLFHGVIVINEEAAFLIKHLSENQDIDSLVELLIKEYDVDSVMALHDIEELLHSLDNMGVLET